MQTKAAGDTSTDIIFLRGCLHANSLLTNIARVSGIGATLGDGEDSVYGQHVTLDLVAQLGLEIAQFLLQARQRREDDGLRTQGATGLYVVVKPERIKRPERFSERDALCSNPSPQ